MPYGTGLCDKPGGTIKILLLGERALNGNGNGVKHLTRNAHSVLFFGLNVQHLPFSARLGIVQCLFNLFSVKNTVKLFYNFTGFHAKIVIETCILYACNGAGLYRAAYTSGTFGLVIDGAVIVIISFSPSIVFSIFQVVKIKYLSLIIIVAIGFLFFFPFAMIQV